MILLAGAGDSGVLPGRGRAVQVYPIKPKLKPPGTKRLKLNCDVLLSTSAFKINLRRYNEGPLLVVVPASMRLAW